MAVGWANYAVQGCGTNDSTGSVSLPNFEHVPAQHCDKCKI